MAFNLFKRLASLIISLMIPVLFTLISVRVVMTPAFLALEYQRPGFPADIYGFTLNDRLHYAPFALEYLLTDADISLLGDLTFPNGRALFTPAELRHMEDVKAVTQVAFDVLLYGGLTVLVLAGFLFSRAEMRPVLRRAVVNGATLTLAIIAVIVLSAIVAWRFFFVAFHQLFFEDGTWVFLYSDTLIRLFPEQFWFDAALVIGGLTLILSIIALGIATGLFSRLIYRQRSHAQPLLDA